MTRAKLHVIAPALAAAMTAQGMSCNELARRVNHGDGSYLARMRKGKRNGRSASVASAKAISLALGEPIEALFTAPAKSTPTSTDQAA